MPIPDDLRALLDQVLASEEGSQDAAAQAYRIALANPGLITVAEFRQLQGILGIPQLPEAPGEADGSFDPNRVSLLDHQRVVRGPAQFDEPTPERFPLTPEEIRFRSQIRLRGIEVPPGPTGRNLEGLVLTVGQAEDASTLFRTLVRMGMPIGDAITLARMQFGEGATQERAEGGARLIGLGAPPTIRRRFPGAPQQPGSPIPGLGMNLGAARGVTGAVGAPFPGFEEPFAQEVLQARFAEAFLTAPGPLGAQRPGEFAAQRAAITANRPGIARRVSGQTDEEREALAAGLSAPRPRRRQAAA